MTAVPGMVDAWAEAVLARHTRNLTRPEFLKAVRALSARYVERRSELTRRPPLDSAGKRAAFAGFYAPLHLYTVLGLAPRLGLDRRGAGDRIVDLGCGTGVASAACALTVEPPAAIEGIDQVGWSLVEASWNWRTLGLQARSRRGDLVQAAERLAAHRGGVPRGTLLLLGWSVNELEATARARLLGAILALVEGGASVLVIEPVSRSATPWWPDWHAALQPRGARADEWALEPRLPPALRAIDEAAGFRRDALTARTLYLSA